MLCHGGVETDSLDNPGVGFLAGVEQVVSVQSFGGNDQETLVGMPE